MALPAHVSQARRARRLADRHPRPRASFSFDLPLVVAVALGAMAATILTCLATTWSALAARPAAFLRSEERASYE